MSKVITMCKSGALRRAGILIAIIAFIVISICAFCAFEEYNTVNTQETECKIIDMAIGFAKSSKVERSVFTIDLGEGKCYTLPSIPTSYVRDYYIGDMLPIIITEYRDGTRNIEINRNAL